MLLHYGRPRTPAQDDGNGVATCPANACTRPVRGFNARLMGLTFGLEGTVYQQAAEDLRLRLPGIDMTVV